MVDQPNSRMKVARTAGTFSIPCICQGWPSLAMHPGFVSGSCFGTEKHLRTFRTLILGSESSWFINRTSFPKPCCFSKTNDAKESFCTRPFRAQGCSQQIRFHACASSSRLPMELSCFGRRLRIFSMSLESICTHEPSCLASTCSKALSESGAFLAILAASNNLLLGKHHFQLWHTTFQVRFVCPSTHPHQDHGNVDKSCGGPCNVPLPTKPNIPHSILATWQLHGREFHPTEHALIAAWCFGKSPLKQRPYAR